MSSTLYRGSGILRALLGSLLLGSMVLGGCGEAPPPSTEPKPVAVGARPVAADAQQAAAIRFTDVTTAAGIIFQHEAGATGKKW